MKIQTPYPNRNKAANFVRQIEQLQRSINKIIERSAMTVADDHSCFLHGSCRVPILVGILFWFFCRVFLRYFDKCSNSFPNYTAYITFHDRPWGPPSLLYNGYRVFPGGKERPGRDVRKNRAIPLLPLWAVRPVQNLSACKKVHFLYYPPYPILFIIH